MCAIPEDQANMSVTRLHPDGFLCRSEMNDLHGAYPLHIYYSLSLSLSLYIYMYVLDGELN